MTDKIESGTAETSQVIGEVGKEQTPEEAEASFAAGFGTVTGETETLGDEPKPSGTEQTETEPADKAAVEDIGELPPEVKQLQKRLRKMEGQYGALNSQYEKLKQQVESQPAGATAVQKEELEEVLRNREAIEKSVAEFQELLPIKHELEGVAQEMRQLKQNIVSGVSGQGITPDQVQEIVTKAIIGSRHPDWEQVANTDEFRAFMLKDGPSQDAYRDYSLALRNPATVAQAQEMVSDWEIDYPQWWADRGKTLFSDDANATIDVLDRFQAAKQAQIDHQNSQQQRQQQRQQRLRSSATPSGVSSDPATGLSDDEAFSKGFKDAYGR